MDISRLLILFLVVISYEVRGRLLDEAFKNGCVFNIVGEDFDDFYIQDNITASMTAGRDCVLIFKDLPKGTIRLSFKTPQKIPFKQAIDSSQEESCGTSFVKIYSFHLSLEINPIHSLAEDVGRERRKKVGHFCSSMIQDRDLSFEFDDRLEVLLIQSKFDVFYEFNATAEADYRTEEYVPPRWVDDTNKTTYSENNKPIYLEKDDCERQLKFPCKYSVVCGVPGSKFLCNKTKYLCIDMSEVCNGVNDCFAGDNSDESRCSFPLIKNVSFVLMTVGICSATAACCLHHKASLRKNNVVRYKGDVIKRKDIIKAKKQGGFAAVETTQASDSNRKNNTSTSPHETDEKAPSQVSQKGRTDSQESFEQKTSKTNHIAVIPTDVDDIEVTDNGLSSGAKILYDYSLSDDEELNDSKYPAGCSYGYRFEFQTFR